MMHFSAINVVFGCAFVLEKMNLSVFAFNEFASKVNIINVLFSLCNWFMYGRSHIFYMLDLVVMAYVKTLKYFIFSMRNMKNIECTKSCTNLCK